MCANVIECASIHFSQEITHMKATRKLGMNRGKRRLWIEGAILNTNGFEHGTRYNVINGDNKLTITIDPQGKRKVAGKPDRPITDMSGSTITNSFADDIAVVSITAVKEGLIIKGVK